MARSSTLLTQTQYAALRRDIKRCLVAADTGVSDGKIEAYWNIGDRIRQERLVRDAGYHNSVLRDLATDLHIAQRSLQRALSLREAYAKPPVGTGLSWSHYRALLQLGSANQRKLYQREALRQGLNARALAAAISSGLYEGGSLPDPTVNRPVSAAHVYRARVLLIVDGDTLDLEIDLGFNVRVLQRTRLACLDAPEIDTPEGRTAKAFVTQQLLPARTVVVQSLKSDVHGRYLVHLFFANRTIGLDDCFRSGVHLNDLLVREGHASVAG